MKHLALLAAAGSLAMFAAPVQAAELPAVPATSYTSFNASPLGAFAPVTAYGDDDRYERRDRYDRRDRRRYRDRDYDRYEGRRLGRNDRVWRGNDGRYRCRRDDGTTGLVIGAIGGALAGRAVDTRGDRSLGTLLGAIGGGLLGREIDRGDARCR
ncbi:MAG: glycine zipper 2TM domain-containing protein [Erythrobacter sp.]|nr:glycine zipper 2TM domain-containing protein [Erythrobacter sp.]